MKYFEELYMFSKILVIFSLLLFLTSFYFISDHFAEMPGCGVKSMDYSKEPASTQEKIKKPLLVVKGKELFESNCTACHAIHKVKVGPALKDISKRRNMKWIRNFVRNPMRMIEVKKDPYAMALYKQHNNTQMTAFPSFSDKDIDAIVQYIEDEQICLGGGCLVN
jgi:cytochrome c2